MPTREKMAPDLEVTGADVNTFHDSWQQQKAAPVINFAAWERELKANGQWPLHFKGQRAPSDVATAVVKGAGPAGICAALELDKLGFNVVLVDCRDANKRLNLVATRAELHRRLHELGALKHLRRNKCWIKVASREMFDEWTQQVLEVKPPVFFDQPGYVRPENMSDQIPTHLISIADLETSLLLAAKEQAASSPTGGIKVVTNATIRVNQQQGTKRNRVSLVPKDGLQPSINLGFPDLIVWATGKRDPDLERDTGIVQQCNLDLTAGPGAPLLAPQAFLLFQLRSKSAVPQPYLHAVLRKELCDAQPQRLVRGWACAHSLANCTVQLPYGLTPRNRSDPPDVEKVERHVLGQLNAEYGTCYADLDALQKEHTLIYGSWSKIFWVDTSLASALTHGSNLVLAGDAGGTSSPGAGTLLEFVLGK